MRRARYGRRRLTEPTVRFSLLPSTGSITGGFGDTYEDGPRRWQHRGIDFSVPIGSPIYAPAGGVITAPYNDGTYGTAGCIAHDGGWYSLLAHLSRLDWQPGARIEAGQLLGLSGNSGYSSGPHCHWELADDWHFYTDISRCRNPLNYMEEEMTEAQINALIEKFVGIAFPAYLEAYFAGGFSARNGVKSEPDGLNPEGKGPIRPWIDDINARLRTIPGVASDQ